MPNREHRVDVAGFQIQPTIDPISGYLRTDARLTRVGVFAYRLADGTIRREFRSPGEVFKPDSMASLRMVPVTNDHPGEPVSAANAKNFSRGSVGDRIDQDATYVSGSLTVWDSELIALAQDGKQELSCGYTCDVVMRQGTWNGIAYDAVQENILYNHVAVVEQGRAGPSVRMRLDSGDIVLAGELSPEVDGMNTEALAALLGMVGALGLEVESERNDSSKITVAGKKYDVSTKEGLAAFKTAMDEFVRSKKAELKKSSKGDSAETGEIFTRLEAKIDALEDQCAALKKENAELKSQTSDDAISKRVDARTKLIEMAKKLAPKAKFDGLDSTGIMRAALIEASPESARKDLEAKFDEKGNVYVHARFDQAIEDAEKRADSEHAKLGNVRELGAASRAARGQTDDGAAKETGAEKDDSDTARAEMLSRYAKKASK